MARKAKKDEIPEVTSEMAEAGATVIYRDPDVSPLGMFFSAPDLATKVYLAMENERLRLLMRSGNLQESASTGP